MHKGKRTVAVVCWLVIGVATASAQDVCAQLRSQLSAIDQGGALAQYQQQQSAYNEAYSQARQMGCIVIFRIFAPPQCGAVLRNLDQLNAQLRAIESAARAAQPVASRAAITAALAGNGCNVARTPRDTYRTVCVRPGDGSYFPISFATRPDHFEADEATCHAQCVGATLFVHRNPGETMEQAVDLTGNLYAETPTAFRYQVAYDPTQRCQVSPIINATLIVQLTAAAAHEQIVPVPRPRPVPSEDPETLANRAGALILPTRRAENPDYLVADGIRLIGPAFYYAQ